jgi:hypothetical protein
MAAISGTELQDIATSLQSNWTPCDIYLPPRCTNCLQFTAMRILLFAAAVLCEFQDHPQHCRDSGDRRHSQCSTNRRRLRRPSQRNHAFVGHRRRLRLRLLSTKPRLRQLIAAVTSQSPLACQTLFTFSLPVYSIVSSLMNKNSGLPVECRYWKNSNAGITNNNAWIANST